MTLTDTSDGTSSVQPCRGLFCFIGAVPATSRQYHVALDAHGFVITDAQLRPDAHLNETWTVLNRRPFPFETSSPGASSEQAVLRADFTKTAAYAVHGMQVALYRRKATP